MQSIAAWLQNGTYEQGVALYQQHGSNSFLKTKFAAGLSEWSVVKLREELGKLAVGSAQLAGEDKVTGAVAEAVKAVESNAADAKKYLALLKQKQRIYQHLNVLMEQKHHLPEGEELRLCALSILNLYQQVTEVWAEIDYYQANGCFVAAPKVPKKPEHSIDKQLQLLRQSISKAKTRLKSPDCKNKVQTQKLLDECIAKRDDLVKKRKGAKA